MGIIFFALFARWGIPGRFVSLFYQAHAQTPSQIGILLSLPQLLSLPITPLICHRADATNSRKNVLVWTQVATFIFFYIHLLALPSLNILVPNLRYHVLLLASCLFGIAGNPAYSIISAISLSQLKHLHGHRGHLLFGQHRLWGAVSWAFSGLVLGAVLDYAPFGIRGVYILFGVSSLFLMVIILQFREAPNEILVEASVDANSEKSELNKSNESHSKDDDITDHNFSDSEEGPQVSMLQALRPVVFQGGIATFLFFNLIFWLGAGMGIVENLLFLYFANDLHASNLLCGTTVAVTVIFEIPLFFLAPRILKRIGAPVLAIIGALAFVIRVVSYSIVSSAWQVLLLEPLHGLTYAAFHAASVAYVSERCSPRFEATGQSILQFVSGIGSAIGSGSGGFIMQRFGSRALYRIGGFAVLVATVGFGVTNYLSRDERNCFHGEELPKNCDIESPTNSSGKGVLPYRDICL